MCLPLCGLFITISYLNLIWGIKYMYIFVAKCTFWVYLPKLWSAFYCVGLVKKDTKKVIFSGLTTKVQVPPSPKTYSGYFFRFFLSFLFYFDENEVVLFLVVQGGSPLKNRLILFVSLPKKSSCHFFGAFFLFCCHLKIKKFRQPLSSMVEKTLMALPLRK